MQTNKPTKRERKEEERRMLNLKGNYFSLPKFTSLYLIFLFFIEFVNSTSI